MYEAYANTSATYTQNSAIVFPNVKFTDSRISTTNGTSFVLKAAGRYLITFCGVGSSTQAASPFSVQFYQNGVAIPAAASTITSTLANDNQTLTAQTLVQVNPSCCAVNNSTTIQLIATSTDTGTLSTANITILKLR